jgi:putative phosphoribosyl transferase
MASAEIRITAPGCILDGTLATAGAGEALVLFAHGSGSSRHSPRNREVASVLNAAGIGTLLFDLLTPEEEREDQVTRHLRFDIPMLAGRLIAATQWAQSHCAGSRGLAIGYFGASTGAGAALIAAARLREAVRAVVSRGGRPDLAGSDLGRVAAPTLLIVGARDTAVIELNQAAYDRLHCEKDLVLVPRATHLFEEPGTLAQAAALAAEWFRRHLLGRAAARGAHGERDAGAGMRPFHDRSEAGRFLAQFLAKYAGEPDVVVLGLPRGGVPVAYEVARALRAPLDVFVVRKLGVPGHEEYAMGAIASGGVRVLNREAVDELGIPQRVIEEVAARELRELERRESAYRDGRETARLEGRTAILVDDGLATGASMRAAVEALKKRNPARIVVAVPVGSAAICRSLAREVDEVVCAITPDPFRAVGLWYDEFGQTTDDEVHDALARAAAEIPRPEHEAPSGFRASPGGRAQ